MNPTNYGRKALNGEAWNVRSAIPGTRHDTLLKAAYSLGTLVPDHLSEAHVIAVLTDAATVATVNAKGVDPLTDEEIESTIRSGLEAGRLNPRSIPIGYTDREDALHELNLIGAVWDQTPMGGWQGRRCKQVMPAILKVARDIGGPKNVPLALARVSTEAGSSRTTVSKALRDLVEEGWLTKKTRGGPGRSARYDIHLPRETITSRSNDDLTLIQSDKWERPKDAMVGHDASRQGCLGPTGVRILEWLSKSPGRWHRQAAVARALGIHAGTVGRYVKPESLLIKSGLIERDEKGSVRSLVPLSLTSLDQLAKAAWTLGRQDRDRARLVAFYQSQGFLDSDLYWIDQRDGSRGSQATWLMPENAAERLHEVDRVDRSTEADGEAA